MTSESRVIDTSLNRTHRRYLIFELVQKLLNTKIGQCTNYYQYENKTRDNDVKFRTTIAIKSEKTNP